MMCQLENKTYMNIHFDYSCYFETNNSIVYDAKCIVLMWIELK